MNTDPAHAHDLAIVALPPPGSVTPAASSGSSGGHEAAYRYLAAVILRLDVASLGSELRATRLKFSLPRAA